MALTLIVIACLLLYLFVGVMLSKPLVRLFNWAMKMTFTDSSPTDGELLFSVLLWPLMIVIVIFSLIVDGISWLCGHFLRFVRWWNNYV